MHSWEPCELVHDGSPPSRSAVTRSRLVAAFVGLPLPVRIDKELSALPVLRRDGTDLCSGNAVARCLAASAAGRLYPRAPFDDASRQLAAEIDAWVDFAGDRLQLVRGLGKRRCSAATAVLLAGQTDVLVRERS